MTPHEWFVEHRLDYVSRSLGPQEARSFEEHLRACAECRAEIARIEEDLDWLPMGLPPVAPRAGFRRRIVDAVLERPAAPRGARWAMPAALAASALLAAGGWYLGSSRSRELQRDLDSQRAMVAALQDTLSIMRQAGRILQANVDVGDGRGGLLIFADEVTHRWNVVIHGLPPASEGHRYQFWFICEDGMVRGNQVPADTAKPTIFATDMPQPQSCPVVKGAALTEEPVADGQGPPKGRSLAHLML
jgi:hypothetical protein